MTRRVLGEIRRVHHMEIIGHEAFRIGCYEAAEKGFFGRHRDNATPYTAHRRYALTLNLNQDYEGGELRFPEYGRMLYRPPAGGAVVFSCALLHEALPVTAGRRFVLLSFFFDRDGARQEQEALARAAKAKSGA
jgi:predicted 2-oxoglutarate/Fe(II)-dependent dioxygenase YbiX